MFRHVEEECKKIHSAKYSLACQPSMVKFYEKFGYKSAGSFLVKYDDSSPYYPFEKELLQELGDWAYGMHLAETLNKKSDEIVIAPYYVFRSFDNKSEMTKLSQWMYANNTFFVKHSLAGNDFLPSRGRRGGNSSRGRKRKVSEPTIITAQDIIKDLERPVALRTLVFQKEIDQSNGCLVHAEIVNDKILIDILWDATISNDRAFGEYSIDQDNYDSVRQVDFEEISHTIIMPRKQEMCMKIAICCNRQRQYLPDTYRNIHWSIEGFWDLTNNKLTILQFRPTPLDRIGSIARNVRLNIYATNFVWGDFEIGPVRVSLDLVSSLENLFIRKGDSAERIEDEVLLRLRNNKSVLLIDTQRGFVLSHEPWFLPNPELRYGYSFMYLPYDRLIGYSDQQVKFVSSNRQGYILPIS